MISGPQPYGIHGTRVTGEGAAAFIWWTAGPDPSRRTQLSAKAHPGGSALFSRAERSRALAIADWRALRERRSARRASNRLHGRHWPSFGHRRRTQSLSRARLSESTTRKTKARKRSERNQLSCGPVTTRLVVISSDSTRCSSSGPVCVARPGAAVRGETLALRTPGVRAGSQADGRSGTGIVLRHIIPSALGTIVVNTTFQVADAILALAALSFLGLGPPPASAN